MKLLNLNNHLIKFSLPKNVLLLFLILSISGCGLWVNFKTYFNTYYNADKIFQETEEQILEARIELFSFEEQPIPTNLSKNFDEVIEKTSAILQHFQESDYVDEALIMTGKSFYYQMNYSRALRKFNELAAIQESELYLENKLWIAKTRLQLRDFSRGLDVLEEVKNEIIENEEDDLLVESYRVEIGYLLYNKDYDAAINAMDGLLKADITDELRSEVLFEKGLLFKLNEDYVSAEKAFEEVEEYSPTFEIEFKSKFEVAKIKSELGEVDNSLELLKNLRSEDKYSDNWNKLDLEIGKIYYDKNEIEEALDRFTEVDTTYKNTEAAGISVFYRAEILENYYKDYDSAMVFYRSASSSKAPRELQIIAQKKYALLEQYIFIHQKLADLNTQLLYLTDEDAFIQDSLEYIEKIKADSIKTASEMSSNTDRRNTPRQTKAKYKEPKRPLISADSLHALNSKHYFDLANLLFTEFDNPDSAYLYYEKSLEEKENNPNQAQTFFAMGNYFLIKNEKEKADSMFTLVYNNYEFDPIRNEAAKKLDKPLYDFDKDPVEDEFNKAEKIYLDSQYDKAIDQLFTIYEENPNSIYASKSLYTIGYILENNLSMPDSAASVYEILSKDYRTSEYAKAINVKLSGYRQEQTRLQAIQDSIRKANEVKIDSFNTNNTENFIQPEDSIKTDVIINQKSVEDSLKSSVIK
jgi:tetratricopeptide (TPR) repeat protein